VWWHDFRKNFHEIRPVVPEIQTKLWKKRPYVGICALDQSEINLLNVYSTANSRLSGVMIRSRRTDNSKKRIIQKIVTQTGVAYCLRKQPVTFICIEDCLEHSTLNGVISLLRD
jgi:hypothetical protein